MKSLLTLTAIFEALTGLALEIAPTLVVSVLLGVSLDGPAATILARLAGVTLLTIAISCWLSRNNVAAPGVVMAMLFYNVAATLVFVYAAIGLQLSAAGLWPAVLAHGVLALWCIQSLRLQKK